MILQALVDYYIRKAADPDSDISSQGFENKEIPFLILLNDKGEFVDIEDTREKIGKKLFGKLYKVPQAVKRSGKNQNPHLLWDNLGYVFGVDKTQDTDSLQKKRAAFLEKIKNFYPSLNEKGEVRAVIKFLESDYLSSLTKHPYWNEMVQTCANTTFKILGCKHLVCQSPDVIQALTTRPRGEGQKKLCLVTGEPDFSVRLHHSIKGLYGAQSSGANIVSFNFDSSESFGKKQGDNAPIGEYACFAYTTALNDLLKSSQKIIFGEAGTLLFWAKVKNPFEELLSTILDSSLNFEPDRLSMAIKSLYGDPNKEAVLIQKDETEFYVLVLSPNAARLSVRVWHKSHVNKLASNIKQHFDDLKIINQSEERKIFSLYTLLQGIALQGKINNLSPHLAGAILKSVFDGTCYPQNLLPIVLARLRDKEGVSCRRASIIKMWLIRYSRKMQLEEREIQMSLDNENKNMGYLLGRLFAILEKVQLEAGKDPHSTIRDRFYGAASTLPITIFPNLIKLKNHYLTKMKSNERVMNFEKVIGEIVDGIIDFPSFLSLQDQGKFAIGYYHQKHFFLNTMETSTK